MNVLSLFNGLGSIWIALDRLGISVEHRYSSEIDKYANIVNDANYPDTIQLGDITKVKGRDLEKIHLLVGGSPCQGFSFAGKQLNFEDPRSKLFFEFVRILEETKPLYFLLENVKMKKESQDVISKYLGVEPIEINSSLVSAQNRRRLYWTNIPNVEQPKDRGIMLEDITEDGEGALKNRGMWKLKKDKANCIDANYFKGVDNHGQRTQVLNSVKGDCFTSTFLKSGINFGSLKNQINENVKHQWQGVYTKKMKTLSVGDGGRNYIYLPGTKVRKLTPLECERLQTLPDNYTNHVSNTQRYKMIGNGWTVEVIAHLLEILSIF